MYTLRIHYNLYIKYGKEQQIKTSTVVHTTEERGTTKVPVVLVMHRSYILHFA